MVRAFRSWLRRKYGHDQQLQVAWHDPKIDLASVRIPSQKERVGDNQAAFRDPQREMPVIDFYRFYNELIPDTIDCFLGVTKRASQRRRVVGTFYGYQYEFSGNPEFGHNALGRLLESPNLDFMMVTASYLQRDLGSGSDYMRSPMTSVAACGKLWYHDNDTVGHVFFARQPKPLSEKVLAEGRLLGATEDAQQTIWKHRRAAGFVLGHGVFESFFDLHGGYYDDPAILDEVGRLNRLMDAAKHDDRSSVAEVLVVSDEIACDYASFNSRLLDELLLQTQVPLTKMGTPFDAILLEHLHRVDMSPYKLVIFLNAFLLTEAQLELIHNRVMCDGRTVFGPRLPDCSQTRGVCGRIFRRSPGFNSASCQPCPPWHRGSS